jgi:hypothetical protein
MGYFVLISSEKLEASEVTPLYYRRQTIEPTFTFLRMKSHSCRHANHSDKTFRSRLLLSSMATVMLIMVKCLENQEKTLAQNTYRSGSPVKALHQSRCFSSRAYYL